MIVGGTSRAHRRFNFSPITLPVAKVGSEVISLPVPNAPWAAPGPASIDLNDKNSRDDIAHDINPLFGAAFFFLAGALRLHPATATAGFLLGVGAAVINYGAGTAAAQEPISFPANQKPGWMQSHLLT